nr:hypothetical protein CFP56_31412 [Quercus suber]
MSFGFEENGFEENRGKRKAWFEMSYGEREDERKTCMRWRPMLVVATITHHWNLTPPPQLPRHNLHRSTTVLPRLTTSTPPPQKLIEPPTPLPPFTLDQARFLRVRIEIPLDKSLRRGGPVVNPEGEKAFVAFKYERLDGLCFNCGHFGHKARDCMLPWNDVDGENPYGEWMRANPRPKSEPARKKSQANPQPHQEDGDAGVSMDPT